MPRASTYTPYMQSNTGWLQNTQQPSNSQSEQTNTLPNSQTNTVQSVPTQDSFLSDVPQSIYSEYSTLDISPTIPTIQESIELTSHTPESVLYRGSSPGVEHTTSNYIHIDLNSPPIPRSPSNQTPQKPDSQTDSLSLESRTSLNNCELINESSIALSLEGLSDPILSEITDSILLQQTQSDHMGRKTTSKVEENKAQNLGNSITEQEFSTPITDAENHDISGELRDLITTSNMILESVKSHEVDEMKNIEYLEQEGDKSSTQPHEVSQPDLSELECDREYSVIIENEISDSLLRQSEHYNNLASKLSNIGFVKVEPGSDEEIEQSTTSTTPVTPRIRRSMRRRTKANYSYPRYSYSGKRSKTRKRSRTLNKVSSLSATENEADDLEVVNVDNEKNEVTNPPAHELSPVQISDGQEMKKVAHSGQGKDDSGNIDKIIIDNESQSNLYLKHNLRSRKILLKLPEGVSKETEEGPVTAPSKKTARAKRSAKKSTSKVIPKKPTKATPKRKTTRRKLITRKTNQDSELQSPNEAENESGLEDNSELGVGVPAKTLSALKEPTTPRKVTTRSIKTVDTTLEARTTKNSSSKKVTPKTSRTSSKRSTTKSIRGRGRGKGKGGSTRGSRTKNHDTEFKDSSGKEPSKIEIVNPTEVPGVEISTDIVNHNSENQVVREQSDVEMNNATQDEPEQVEESVSTPKLPKRTRKSTRRLVGGSKSTKSTSGGKQSRGRKVDTQADDNAARDNEVNIEPSDKEEETIPTTKPKKATRSANRKGQTRVIDNTTTEQPPVPASDPDIVEISSINPTALANVVNTLAGQNYDILSSPESASPNKGPCTPVFVKPHVPATRSSSPSNTPPPELQAKLTKPPTATPSSLEWSRDHWHHLKVFYEETKSEYISSGKDVNRNKDVYSKVIEKFFEADINNRTFGEEDLRLRIISLETADHERNNEPSSDQRSSNIENSVILYNKTYSNLRDNIAGNKRKRRGSSITNAVPGIEGKVPKRSRVEENNPSGSGTTTPASAPQTPSNNMLSKLFGGWFNSGQSRSNPASLNEEAPEDSDNNVDENEDRMEEEQSTHNSRNRSWLW